MVWIIILDLSSFVNDKRSNRLLNVKNPANIKRPTLSIDPLMNQHFTNGTPSALEVLNQISQPHTPVHEKEWHQCLGMLQFGDDAMVTRALKTHKGLLSSFFTQPTSKPYPLKKEYHPMMHHDMLKSMWNVTRILAERQNPIALDSFFKTIQCTIPRDLMRYGLNLAAEQHRLGTRQDWLEHYPPEQRGYFYHTERLQNPYPNHATPGPLNVFLKSSAFTSPSFKKAHLDGIIDHLHQLIDAYDQNLCALNSGDFTNDSPGDWTNFIKGYLFLLEHNPPYSNIETVLSNQPISFQIGLLSAAMNMFLPPPFEMPAMLPFVFLNPAKEIDSNWKEQAKMAARTPMQEILIPEKPLSEWAQEQHNTQAMYLQDQHIFEWARVIFDHVQTHSQAWVNHDSETLGFISSITSFIGFIEVLHHALPLITLDNHFYTCLEQRDMVIEGFEKAEQLRWLEQKGFHTSLPINKLSNLLGLEIRLQKIRQTNLERVCPPTHIFTKTLQEYQRRNAYSQPLTQKDLMNPSIKKGPHSLVTLIECFECHPVLHTDTENQQWMKNIVNMLIQKNDLESDMSVAMLCRQPSQAQLFYQDYMNYRKTHPEDLVEANPIVDQLEQMVQSRPEWKQHWMEQSLLQEPSLEQRPKKRL